jgi:hypothetical protein
MRRFDQDSSFFSDRRIRDYIMGKMEDLHSSLARDPTPARRRLLKHVSEIRIMPQQVEDGKGNYVAKGE